MVRLSIAWLAALGGLSRKERIDDHHQPPDYIKGHASLLASHYQEPADHEALLVKEEQFGPIVPVLRYSDVDDAIARANDSNYGLGGTVWGKDLDRAFRAAAKIESGIV
jgi:acyl-CoA reductase-like NAD-dependent aldehyde dehydrogenase